MIRDQINFQQHVQQCQASVRHQLQENIQGLDSSLVDSASAVQHEVERRRLSLRLVNDLQRCFGFATPALY